jgi:hypothetical protein
MDIQFSTVGLVYLNIDVHKHILSVVPIDYMLILFVLSFIANAKSILTC